MSLPRHHSFSRAVIAVLMLFAWFIATNHCALGLMQKSAVANGAHASCCNGKPSPAKDEPVPGGVRECCKAIHAIPLADGTVLVKDEAFSVVDALAFPAAADHRKSVQELLVAPHEHGPPRAVSFAELVLHRSLRAHAPPFAA